MCSSGALTALRAAVPAEQLQDASIFQNRTLSPPNCASPSCLALTSWHTRFYLLSQESDYFGFLVQVDSHSVWCFVTDCFQSHNVLKVPHLQQVPEPHSFLRLMSVH